MIFLVGGWPIVSRVAPQFLVRSNVETVITIKTANGTVRYKATGYDEASQELKVRLMGEEEK